MQYLYISIQTILIAFIVAEIHQSEIYRTILSLLHLNFKPLNCPVCFNFWLMIILGFVFNYEYLLFSGVGAYIAGEISKKINQY